MGKVWVQAISMLALAAVASPAPVSAVERVRVTGEVVDTWCAVSGIMYGYGTAHHQCAVWCAVGGIPVSIRAEDGATYMVLRIEGDATTVANPRLLDIQTHQVTVDGDLYRRDGVNYLLVDQVASDGGIVNLTHEEYGIVPFGE
jgi:hypothetical protein